MTSGPNRSNAISTPVYVIDDDASIVEEVGDFLKLKGFVVKAFSVPAEALEQMLAESEPFLLVTDMQMPGLSGLDLVRELRHFGGSPRVFETILFSAFADLDRAINALKLGVLDFLVKPVDLDQLVAAIHRAAEALDQRRDAKGNDRDLSTQLAETLAKAKELTSTIENAAVRLSRESITPATSPLARPAAAPPPSAGPAQPVHRLVVNPPRTLPGQAPEEGEMLHRIKALQAARRFRDKLLPSCVDGDANWEILLYLIEQSLLHRVVSVTSACHATTLPSTTAMRKIDELVSTGWLQKRPDPSDRRRTLIAPTDLCRERMRNYLLGLPVNIGTPGFESSVPALA
ncbi:response regulator [Zavarzinia compransoris]|uniref:response regulator n=1 Tax=Zavarzinia marina TaxID=2911065 RepID=UPI001F247106|nr:response regulator [Zavarzinia marina]MCF4166127.1 response regulator [Zavarzinia marina]